ncbi:MAG: hypothetical protein IJS74_03670 [Clostridia bacterium]|nr:hypothetical protein [Clostridia bacterium]
MRYILKFGGSSLSTTDKIKQVANFITKMHSRKDLEIVVVVSAMGKTTTSLQTLADQISLNNDQYSLASLLAKGEEISANLLSLALNALHAKNQILTAMDIKIHVKGHPNNAIITSVDTQNIINLLQSGNIVIVPGFQGVDDNGKICTLGRGGSDTTATAFGASLDAKVKIYTDVPGFFKFDPNLFLSNAKLTHIDSFSAIELASSGAKVMDQTSLEIGYAHNVPVKVCQSQTNEGTNITTADVTNLKISGISFKNKLCFVKNCKNREYLLQNYIKDNGKKILFHSLNKINSGFEEIVISDISLLSMQNCKIQSLTINPCELITITGSGLFDDVFYNFIGKLKILYKNSILFINLTPTTIKIATKQRKALKITKYINDFCKMENIL